MDGEQEIQSERRLSVIMFSDIVGYSRMMQEDEDLAMNLLTLHNAMIRECIKTHGGTEIKVIGDAFLVHFNTVTSAVRCAIEIQERFSKYNEGQSEPEKILVRIGIHLGDIIIKENDVFGDGVNIASRIEPLAEPGGICISQEVYNLVKHKLDVQVVSLGAKELKNIRDKIEIYEILVGSIAGKDIAALGGRTVATRKPFFRRPAILAGAAIVLVCLVAVVYLIMSRTPAPPRELESRSLRTPGYAIGYATISPDGNWVAYTMDNSKWGSDVYIQPASGDQPKKFIGDSLYRARLSFSPDASELLYDQNDQGTTAPKNIYRAPILGGSPRKIISDGGEPSWSPDGTTIAFARHHEGTAAIWTANPDGSGQKQIAEVPSEHPSAFAWSPDGRNLALVRHFGVGYDEIVILDIRTGQQRQLTDDKTRKNNLCWATPDEIIYDARKGSIHTLWTISPHGGAPVQLPSVAEVPLYPSASKDGKKLLCLALVGSFNLWAMDVQARQSRQLTFEDGVLLGPVFSPRGDKILYRRFHFRKMELLIANTDASEPVSVNYGLGMPKHATWSGDGKAIAYTVGRVETVGTNPDSTRGINRIFIRELGKDSAQFVTEGLLVDWSPDGKHMLIQRNESEDRGQPIYDLVRTDSPRTPIRQIESLFSPSFTCDSRDILTTDSVSLWRYPIDSGSGRIVSKLPSFPRWLREMPDGKSIGILSVATRGAALTFIKVSKTTKKTEKVCELSGDILDVTSSPDMKTLLYTKGELRNKLVLVDNFR